MPIAASERNECFGQFGPEQARQNWVPQICGIAPNFFGMSKRISDTSENARTNGSGTVFDTLGECLTQGGKVRVKKRSVRKKSLKMFVPECHFTTIWECRLMAAKGTPAGGFSFMTSTTDADLVGNGASTSEAVLPEGAEGIADILKMVTDRSLDHLGRLDLDSSSLAMLRSQEKREAALRELVIAMMPDRINPAIWMRWLQGGAAPFDRAKLERSDPGGQSISRALERQSRRVLKAQSRAHQARGAHEASAKKLEQAEAELSAARSLDAALIEYAVSEHLMHIMQPMFAMGPAWTLMRVVSAHVDPAMHEIELSLIKDPKRREERARAIQTKRQEGTEKLLDVLDNWAGDMDFEDDLREALVAVADKYASQERPDHPRRSRAAMKRGVSEPETVRDRDAILKGMERQSC